MADGTKIEWTEATWNPIRARLRSNPSVVGWHCEHASPGCEHCYSETRNLSGRCNLGTRLPFKPGHRADVEVYLDEKVLTQPLRWKRPRQIFVCSMTDLFGAFVTDEMLDRVFAVMALSPQHTFQVLTKRSARMRRYFEDRPYRNVADFVQPEARRWWVAEAASKLACTLPEAGARIPDHIRTFGQLADFTTLLRYGKSGWPLPNVWLGVSVEDQQRADERVPDLLATPAAVRWLSCEPLLGPLRLDRLWQRPGASGGWHDALTGREHHGPAVIAGGAKLDWIVAGGESGPGARPMHPDWARGLRDQCAAAGVPFFFKQWGEYRPCTEAELKQACGATLVGGRLTGAYMMRAGKKRAGRLLDGVEHNGMPA